VRTVDAIITARGGSRRSERMSKSRFAVWDEKRKECSSVIIQKKLKNGFWEIWVRHSNGHVGRLIVKREDK